MVSLPNAETGTMDRISDDDDDEPSSGSETYEEGDLLSAAMDDDVTAQLAAAGWQYKHINGDFHFFAFSLFCLFIHNPIYFRVECNTAFRTLDRFVHDVEALSKMCQNKRRFSDKHQNKFI